MRVLLTLVMRRSRFWGGAKRRVREEALFAGREVRWHRLAAESCKRDRQHTVPKTSGRGKDIFSTIGGVARTLKVVNGVG